MRGFLGLALLTLAAAPRPAEKAFSDITKESGIEEGVARHGRDFPKVWLSGLTLVDLDGDGALDLHVGSHSGPTAPAMTFRNDGKGKFTIKDVPEGTWKLAAWARDMPTETQSITLSGSDGNASFTMKK